MSTHDGEATLGALRDSLDGVAMHTPVEQIVAAGRARRRRRRVTGLATVTTGVAAVTGLALGVPALSHPSTAPPSAGHFRAAAFTLDRHADGTIHVTWDKRRYFEDHAGLERALRAAGFPVLVREGTFCTTPKDDPTLDASGSGVGVDRVVRAQRTSDDSVVFIYTPSAMPAGKQLFIGYLSPAQLAVTHGHPGSVERIISTGAPLTCTTQAPPPGPAKPGGADKPGGPDKRPAPLGPIKK